MPAAHVFSPGDQVSFLGLRKVVCPRDSSLRVVAVTSIYH